MTTGDTVHRGAVEARSSTMLRVLARAGFVANGLIHVIIGATAIAVALGFRGRVDESGALHGIAASPAGLIALWLIAIALFALAAWQFVVAFAFRASKETTTWGRRIAETGKGVAYAAVGATAVVVAFGGSADQEESSRTVSGFLLATPGGVLLLALIGLGIVAVGVAFVVQGITRTFLRTIRRPVGSGGTVLLALGVAGYLAKGVAVAIIGVLFVVAAVSADPDAAKGLDGALKTLLTLPFGVVLLVVVGAGLTLYGVFFIARSGFARI